MVVAHACCEESSGSSVRHVQRAAVWTGCVWAGFGWSALGWSSTEVSVGAPLGESSGVTVPSESGPVPQAARHTDCRCGVEAWTPLCRRQDSRRRTCDDAGDDEHP